MKRLFALICILTFAITVFCCCDGSFDYVNVQGDGYNAPTVSPYASQQIANVQSATYKVYVCGAVENEGYYVVEEGKTIADAVALAGLLPQTMMPQNAVTYIKNHCQIAVRYYENGVAHDCINVNGMIVMFNLTVENVPADVIAKLHAYYTENGKITNKQVIKQILTDEQYQQNHYKLFIAEKDYEAAD